MAPSIIKNNPFRILGVYSSATLKEITANKAKLNSYAKVGKTIDFNSDLNTLFPPIVRDNNSIEQAASSINLPIDKIKFTLFWFSRDTHIDDIALNYLEAGDIAKTIEILDKKNSFSSLINKGVLAMIQGDYNASISSITEMIHNDTYRDEFIEKTADSASIISKKELAELYISTLLEELPSEDWIQIFKISGKSSDDTEYLISLLLLPHVREIENLIEKSSTIDKKQPAIRYASGIELMHKTKNILKKISDIAGKDSSKYQFWADKSSKEILECVIDYFNNTDDNDREDNSLALQQYALSIANGQLIKDRCLKNIAIIKEAKDEKIIQSELKLISGIMNSLSNNAPTESLSQIKKNLQDSKPILEAIKNLLGETNETYLKISSIIADTALSKIIKIINRKQSFAAKIKVYDDLKDTINSSIPIINFIETLDINPNQRARLNENKKELMDFLNRMNSIQTLLSSDNKDDNTGCWVIVIIVLILAIIGAINS